MPEPSYLAFEVVLSTLNTRQFIHPMDVRDAVTYLQTHLHNTKYEFKTYPDPPPRQYLEVSGLQEILFSGVKYYFPMKWLITYDYPNVPPRITLEPTADMVINTDHESIKTPNLVEPPSYRRWGRGSLASLHAEIIASFQKKTPLKRKPSNLDPTSQQICQALGELYNDHIITAATAAVSAAQSLEEIQDNLLPVVDRLETLVKELQIQSTNLPQAVSALKERNEEIRRYLDEHPEIDEGTDPLTVNNPATETEQKMWKLQAQIQAFDEMKETLSQTKINPEHLQQNLNVIRRLAVEDLQTRCELFQLSVSLRSEFSVPH